MRGTYFNSETTEFELLSTNITQIYTHKYIYVLQKYQYHGLKQKRNSIDYYCATSPLSMGLIRGTLFFLSISSRKV